MHLHLALFAAVAAQLTFSTCVLVLLLTFEAGTNSSLILQTSKMTHNSIHFPGLTNNCQSQLIPGEKTSIYNEDINGKIMHESILLKLRKQE